MKKPSASMIVAIIALILAAAGTAIATSNKVSGDKLIKKGSLSGNRLRKNTVTGKQINLNKLGKVPNATKADSATNAVNAQNAAALGGRGIRWALVDPNGAIVQQTGGFALSDHSLTGAYIINAGGPVAGHAVVISGGLANDNKNRGTPFGGPCGTSPGELDCSKIESNANDGNHVVVGTGNAANTGNEDHSFYLVIY